MQPADAVLRFLSSVGPGSEAELYLRLFREAPPHSFAAIVVDAATMRDSIDGVAMDLQFLRALELTPIVVLGLYEPESVRVQGERLAQRLLYVGQPVETLSTHAQPDEVRTAVERGAVPLVGALGEALEERLRGLGRMLSALHTHKLIFLRTPGGLRQAGERVSMVNLSDEYEQLASEPTLGPDGKALLDISHQLVFQLAHRDLAISVTSPLNLLRELFTVKGAGTMLRRGSRILQFPGLQQVDRARLGGLLESSFARPVAPSLFDRPIARTYLEEEYRGAALLLDSPFGPYLTKFAVTRQAQGEGIGRDLWRVLDSEHPSLLWRARTDNPIARWYEQRCDSRVRTADWSIYLKGVAHARIPEAVDYVLAQPVDF